MNMKSNFSLFVKFQKTIIILGYYSGSLKATTINTYLKNVYKNSRSATNCETAPA